MLWLAGRARGTQRSEPFARMTSLRGRIDQVIAMLDEAEDCNFNRLTVPKHGSCLPNASVDAYNGEFKDESRLCVARSVRGPDYSSVAEMR